MTQTQDPHHSPQHSLDAEQAGYKQTLGRRHVQMIAIGGAIGTGLFLGSASRLHNNGPALLFSYAFVGVIAYLLMRALGELVLHRATSGAFVSYMREFYGEKWAFVTGWMYWLNWALTGIAELSAVGLYVQYWFPLMPTWATVLIALAVVLVINLLSARAFGEFEFWAAILKVGAIVIFLVVGTVVVIGGFSIGGHEAGFHNLWSNPGGFWPHTGDYNWYGPILAMSGVVFAYAAIEMVGVAAGEMEDAKTEVPKAVNAVIFRIAVFYCGSILLLVSMLPTTEYKSGTSPFVTVFERMGMAWMSALIQLVLIVAALSSLNAGLYSTGRVLRSLGMSKQAPAFTPEDERVGRALGRDRDDLGGLRVRLVAQLPRPGRVRDRPGGGGHRRHLHLGDDLRLPAAAAAADRRRGDPAQPVPGCRGLRTRATSGWRSSRWCWWAWPSRAGRARRTSPTRSTSWSSSSGSRSWPWCWPSAGGPSSPRWSRTPATGWSRCGRTTARATGRRQPRRSRRGRAGPEPPADRTSSSTPGTTAGRQEGLR